MFYAAIYWVSHAMTAFGGLSQGVAFVGLSALVLYMAAHWAAAFWASFTIGRRTGWPLWVHLPVVWVATEFSRNYLFTGFPWGNLGYTQVRNGPVAQLAALGGVYAVAGLVVLVNCVAAAWWRSTRAGGGAPRPWQASAVAAAAVAATIAYGTRAPRRGARRDGPGTLGEDRAGAGQREPGGEEPGAAPRRADRRPDVAAHARGRPGGSGARGLARGVLAAGAPPRPLAACTPRPRTSSRSGRPHLLLGATTVKWTQGPEGRVPQVENSAFLLAPDLTVLDRYVKHHLVPFGEYVPLREWLPFLRSVVPTMAPIAAGGRLVPMSFESGGRRISFAPMICFDAIFPEVARTFVLQDADFLVNPTNDAWYGYSSGPYQFLAIVRMRAIETGRSVARPAYSGVSAIVYPTGELGPGRPRGRAGRPGARPRPGRAAAPARGRAPHPAGPHALHEIR